MGDFNGKICLVIDYCNYEDYQIGGHLSFAKNLLSAFTNNLTLVGITTNKNDKVGRWFKKTINGITYDYFALTRYNKLKTKHILPDRLACFLFLRLYKQRILRINIQNVFVQRHEILPAIINFRFKNICYRFPGLESPLKISKYWFGKYFADKFDKVFFSCLQKVKLVLASGDEKAIQEMVHRSMGTILKSSVIKFPTRINTDIFKPLDKHEARGKLNISTTDLIILTTGRLAWLKGWKFMIDCFILFKENFPNSLFYIIGEGEDFLKIQEYLFLKKNTEKVILVGAKRIDEIALFLNASDLFIIGSYKEGWSTSLSEAIACGIPACVTNFSSAKEIIKDGKNGFVIDEHNEDLFVKGMFKAMKIPRPVYNDNVIKYSIDRLKEDLLNIWELI